MWISPLLPGGAALASAAVTLTGADSTQSASGSTAAITQAQVLAGAAAGDQGCGHSHGCA